MTRYGGATDEALRVSGLSLNLFIYNISTHYMVQFNDFFLQFSDHVTAELGSLCSNRAYGGSQFSHNHLMRCYMFVSDYLWYTM